MIRRLAILTIIGIAATIAGCGGGGGGGSTSGVRTMIDPPLSYLLPGKYSGTFTDTGGDFFNQKGPAIFTWDYSNAGDLEFSPALVSYPNINRGKVSVYFHFGTPPSADTFKPSFQYIPPFSSAEVAIFSSGRLVTVGPNHYIGTVTMLKEAGGSGGVGTFDMTLQPAPSAVQ